MLSYADVKTVLDGAVTISNLGSKIWCGQTYNNVFSGETLVDVLLKDPNKYPSRETAVQYAQVLLDSRVITCITKHRTFDDGERLYCINHKALEKIPSLPEVAQKSASTKMTTERKEAVSKQNSRESDPRGIHTDRSAVDKASAPNDRPSVGLRVSPNLQRLLEKDAAQGHTRVISPPSSKMASSDKGSAVAESGFGGSLKDKDPEAHKDLTLTGKAINVNSSKTKTGEKVGLQKIMSPSPSEKASSVHSKTSGSVKADKKLTILPDENLKDDTKRLSESEISNSLKQLGADAGTARLNGKQKVCKTLSPALTALIEKDAKNSQASFKNGKKQSENEVKQDITGSKVNKINEELSNSWDAFELKLQNKVKKTSQILASGEDAHGQEVCSAHASTPARRQEERKAMSFVGSTKNKEEKNKLDGQSSREKHTLKSKNEADSPKLVVSNENEVMPGVPENRKVRMIEVEKYSTETIKEKVSGSKANLQVNMAVKGEHFLVPTVREGKSSFLGAEESKNTIKNNIDKKFTLDQTDTANRERGSSFNSNDGSKSVVTQGTSAGKDSLYFGRESMDSKERVPSFSLRSETATVVIEDYNGKKKPVSSQESTVRKEEFGSKQRTSLGSRDDSNSVKVDSSPKDVKQTNLEANNPIQHSSSGKTLHSSSQEEFVQVDGHAMPKSLARLLAKDGSSLDKKEQISTDGDTNVYKDRLKELKKRGPPSADLSPSFTISKSGEQSSAYSSTKVDSTDRDEKASDNIPVLRLPEVMAEKGNDTIKDSSGKVSSPLFGFHDAEENNASFVKDTKKTIALKDPKRGQYVSGNITQGASGNPSARDLSVSEYKPSAIIRKSTETPPSSYPAPRLNVSPSTSHSCEDVSKVSTSNGFPTRPSSLVIQSSPKWSPRANDDGSPAQLRKELEKSRLDFQESKRKYENKITELQLQIDYLRRQRSGQLDVDENSCLETASMSELSSLFSSFSTPVVSPGNSNVTSPSPTPNATPRSSVTVESLSISPRSPPPPPPPAPPSVPAVPIANGGHVKTNKPVVNPNAEMKPLFWNRIITSTDSTRKGKTVWQTMKEPAIDTTEFERLFSKKTADRKLKRTKSLRDDKHFARVNGKKIIGEELDRQFEAILPKPETMFVQLAMVHKLLETDRSRAIGIKMSSLNCQLEDIRNAVYNMDTSIVDMDSLQSIYDIYPKDEEIQLIQEHFRKLPAVALDKPEEFMHQLTKMKHFKERLECWLFQDKFSEIMYGIDRSLACVTEGCSVITTNAEIAAILALVLAYGNYMNGNTTRGQADGFHLDVLLKLRDVKAKDSDVNLLQYTVKQYLKQHERSTDKNKNESRLPSSVALSNAAQISFEKLKEELLKVAHLLRETEQQVKIIVEDCPSAQRNPFEDKMRTFQRTSKQTIAEANVKMEKAETTFWETVEYFQWESGGKKATPHEFFSLWAKFIEEVKNCVKLEKQQQHLVKKNFSKIEHLNQIREAATKFRKRRQSVDMI